MNIPPISEPYQQTVGVLAALMESGNGAAASDPAKVAQIVLHVSELAEPPLRLLIGTDAVNYAAVAEKARADADAQWRELSLSTDHDESTASDLDPLGNRP
jgi:hypothetical protein